MTTSCCNGSATRLECRPERTNGSRSKLAAAKRYVAHAVGTATVDDDLLADCIVSCAADLFNMRDARLGVMDVGDSTVEPFRISTDPLRSVWPKLRAAGVLTGGMVIA